MQKQDGQIIKIKKKKKNQDIGFMRKPGYVLGDIGSMREPRYVLDMCSMREP
jgi:hypothetical protein